MENKFDFNNVKLGIKNGEMICITIKNKKL